jgi:hypothetical protein
MPIRHSLWSVGIPPRQLPEGQLPSEFTLHQMIKQAPELLSADWMLIGSEVPTYGGRLDLLAIAPDASLVLIELKRDRTPREVVAQALDYASWVEKLQPADVAAVYRGYSDGGDLAEAFRARFARPLPEDDLNAAHSIVIVASELDPASERIVQYLADRDVAINVLFFRIFEGSGGQLLSRAWLVDPIEAPSASPVRDETGRREPWNGEFYVSFGEGDSRSWEEARGHGFITAGGAPWYTRTLKLLSPGARIWVNIPGRGYVGVGIVTGPMQALAEYTLTADGVERPAVDVLTGGTYQRDRINDEENCAYFVPVRWLQTVPADQAKRETGFFGNQNTVAAPRTPAWRTTVERLKVLFPNHES